MKQDIETLLPEATYTERRYVKRAELLAFLPSNMKFNSNT